MQLLFNINASGDFRKGIHNDCGTIILECTQFITAIGFRSPVKYTLTMTITMAASHINNGSKDFLALEWL